MTSFSTMVSIDWSIDCPSSPVTASPISSIASATSSPAVVHVGGVLSAQRVTTVDDVELELVPPAVVIDN